MGRVDFDVRGPTGYTGSTVCVTEEKEEVGGYWRNLIVGSEGNRVQTDVVIGVSKERKGRGKSVICLE